MKEIRKLSICSTSAASISSASISGSFILEAILDDEGNQVAGLDFSPDDCFELSIGFIANPQSCDYSITNGLLMLDDIRIHLHGVSVSKNSWSKNITPTGWRYAGAIKHQYSPYIVRVSGDDLVWLEQGENHRLRGFFPLPIG